MIKAPRWIKNPKATKRGWVNAKTGELLKSMAISQADCDEFNGVKAAPIPVEPAPVFEPRVLHTPVFEEKEPEEDL